MKIKNHLTTAQLARLDLRAWALGNGKYGPNTRTITRTRTTGAHSTIGTGGNQAAPSVLALNRATFKLAARYWKSPGPAVGKAPWKAMAAAHPVMDYHGNVKNLTGRGYWLLASKYDFSIYFPHPQFPIDESRWFPLTGYPDPTPLPVVTLGSPSLAPDGTVTVITPWFDIWQYCALMADISVPPSAPIPTATRMHMACGTISNWNGPGIGDCTWTTSLRYPYFAAGIKLPITFALRIFNFRSYAISDYQWFST